MEQVRFNTKHEMAHFVQAVIVTILQEMAVDTNMVELLYPDVATPVVDVIPQCDMGEGIGNGLSGVSVMVGAVNSGEYPIAVGMVFRENYQNSVT